MCRVFSIIIHHFSPTGACTCPDQLWRKKLLNSSISVDLPGRKRAYLCLIVSKVVFPCPISFFFFDVFRCQFSLLGQRPIHCKRIVRTYQYLSRESVRSSVFELNLSWFSPSHLLPRNAARQVAIYFFCNPASVWVWVWVWSRVLHDNEFWHASQLAYVTNTYNLNSCDSRTRAWADVSTQRKRYHIVARPSPLIFFIKIRAREFSRSLRQPPKKHT